MFVAVFTKANHPPSSSVRIIKSTLSDPISLRSILISSSYLHLTHPSYTSFQVSPSNPSINIFTRPYVTHAPPVWTLLEKKKISSP
jgi:hypothetical protein